MKWECRLRRVIKEDKYMIDMRVSQEREREEDYNIRVSTAGNALTHNQIPANHQSTSSQLLPDFTRAIEGHPRASNTSNALSICNIDWVQEETPKERKRKQW